MTREEALAKIVDAVEKPEIVAEAMDVLKSEPAVVEKIVPDEELKTKYEQQVQETEKVRNELKAVLKDPYSATPRELNDSKVIEEEEVKPNFGNLDFFGDIRRKNLKYSGMNE